MTQTFFKEEREEKRGTPIPEETRWAIFSRCQGKCEYCGNPAVDAHHILSRAQGGSNNVNNLIALCRECHDNDKIRNKIAEKPKYYMGRYKW